MFFFLARVSTGKLWVFKRTNPVVKVSLFVLFANSFVKVCLNIFVSSVWIYSRTHYVHANDSGWAGCDEVSEGCIIIERTMTTSVWKFECGSEQKGRAQGRENKNKTLLKGNSLYSHSHNLIKSFSRSFNLFTKLSYSPREQLQRNAIGKENASAMAIILHFFFSRSLFLLLLLWL